ncbi:flagellin [Succinivibrio dextrinosolvens]|jgi:flagellin|uniref:flagellin N-terminal helical domain-containing protein n=2 Tax=Succinivibrio dextrinosolvens TaxID=83771 RepID=UPI0004E13C07|nr:flagellin [Succinivibrio dextrinosolvens]
MALYVPTNTSSINAQRRLNTATKALDTTFQHLASGLRINSARDDAAGLQISDRLTSQINGLKQGNRNANDGIALCQTMEGALDETTNMLQRIRTLAIQSANGTNTEIDRKSIQQEVTALSEEITRIACKTTFGGQQCLAGPKGLLGPSGIITFHVGAYENDTISLSLTAGFTLQGICGDTSVLTAAITAGANLLTTNTGISNTAGFYQFSVLTQQTSELTIAAIDKIINVVDTHRAALGALQNRMESTIRNQEVTHENVSDARSRIRDADYAEEAANLSAQTITQQAATSVLTQANQRPQIALNLLGG